MNYKIKNTSPAPRWYLNKSIKYRRPYARNSKIGVLKNISSTGAFLEINQSETSQSLNKIILEFYVGSRQRRLLAQVVWYNSLGVGLRFLPSNHQDIQIIEDFIYFLKTSLTSQKLVLENIFKQVA